MKINLIFFYRVAFILFSVSMIGLFSKLLLGNENFYRSVVSPLNSIIFVPSFFLSFLATICGLILILKKEKYKNKHLMLFVIICTMFLMMIYRAFFM
jgi:uncharacterized membrane protein YozB (DUF420 family)